MKTVQFRAPIVFFFPIDWPAGAFSISIDWHSEFLPTPSIALTIIASILDSSRCLGFWSTVLLDETRSFAEYAVYIWYNPIDLHPTDFFFYQNLKFKNKQIL